MTSEQLARYASLLSILDLVARYYYATVAGLQSPIRSRSVAFPRKVFMYLARRHTRATLEEIGTCVGGRHHTTVRTDIQSIEAAARHDQILAAQLVHLAKMIEGGKEREVPARTEPPADDPRVAAAGRLDAGMGIGREHGLAVGAAGARPEPGERRA
jgi:hypothetical protein